MGRGPEGGGGLRFTDEQVRRVCSAILSRWKKERLIRPKASDGEMLAAMTAEIRRDMEREAELDRDAEVLLERHIGSVERSQANSRILFHKIKERLARERGVVL